MMQCVSKLQRRLDRFLFESCDVNTCVLIRISYALLLIVYVLVWMLDGPMWFSDKGVMSAKTASSLMMRSNGSLFFWIPATALVVQLCLSVLLVQAICLLLGVYSRFQVICIFGWLVSFQYRNPLICDGEDTVFRLLAFMMIFLPMDHAWSLARRLGWTNQKPSTCPNAWGLRLIQIEMSLIYLSAAWSKLQGNTWRDGSALYYVFQMNDLFGRGWLPELILRSESIIRFSTWSVVVVEAILPLALWWRPTRNLALFLGIGLHFTIEYSMDLFLFEWIMVVGLLSFLDTRSLRRRSAASADREPIATRNELRI